MEAIISTIKEQMNMFELDPKKEQSMVDKVYYIASYLNGFTEYLKKSKFTSVQEIKQEIEIFKKDLIQKLIEENIIPRNSCSISLEAINHKVMQLLNRHITKNVSEALSKIKEELIVLVEDLFFQNDSAKEKIAKNFLNTFFNGVSILIYGNSLNVVYSLIYAKKSGKTFKVYLGNNSLNENSNKVLELFKKYDIECKLITGISICYYLSKVDFVLTGADAICESGGIINDIGTNTIAICAKNSNKPFYVLVSSLKFLEKNFLEQKELESINKKYSVTGEPIVDYTPPEYITTFFTDDGIFLPNTIGNKVIQLFYYIK
jgi:translation initiation factor 2B subunit (eIF-2B alpha/beta/delta family)